MRTFKLFAVFALALALASSAFGQACLTQTSLSAAVTTTSGKTLIVASTSACTSTTGNGVAIAGPNLTNGTSVQLYIDTEMLDVEAVNGTLVTVRRGANGTRPQTHASGATVYAGSPNQAFFAWPQWGSCTAANQPVLPIIDYNDQYIENCVNSAWNLVVQGTVNFPQPVTLTSAYTNATTSFTSVFPVGIPVHAGLPYTIRCDIIWQGSAATAGPKYEFTGPASPTKVAAAAVSAVTATTFSQVVVTSFSSPMANAGTVTASTNLHDTVTLGLINGANSGTVTLLAAANGSGTLTIQPGSFCVQQ